MNTQQTVGIIGLGAMGQGICYRLRKATIAVIGFDTNLIACTNAQKLGVSIASSIENLASSCSIIWLMIPAGNTVTETITLLTNYIAPNSIIIDGGNSNFHDSLKNSQTLERNGSFFLDCGTSGGLAGKENGYCCMVGGQRDAFDRCEFIFKALAAPKGYVYVGPSGSGHYVKMVHNGIEYALLQAYAEGFQLLQEGSYKNLNLAAIANVWEHGSIIRSHILELMKNVLIQNPNLSTISGVVDSTGMGQWTIEEAQAHNIPVQLIEDALKIRELSHQTGGSTATKFVALLRNAFGGHKVHTL